MTLANGRVPAESSSHAIPGKVEMVGGLVEQQDVGMLDEGFDQGEAFLPAAG